MPVLRNSRFWLACVAGWIFLALIEASASHFDALRADRASAFVPLFAQRLAADSVWAPLTAIVFALMGRAMAAGLSTRSIFRRFALFALLLPPLYAFWDAAAFALLNATDFSGFIGRMSRLALTTYIWGVFLYSMVALVAYSILLYQRSLRHERESAELRERLIQAELELLRAQLKPHFLFNALNTVAGLIRGGRHELATSALAQLSELLRYVIEASRQERVPLAWEVQFVANYLRLQQIRFGNRLQYTIDQDKGSSGCEVPPLLLQPLIENAVVHGAARNNEPASIEVRLAVAESQLRVEVRNTRDAHAQITHTTGVGLNNTRQRLEHLYGNAFSLDAGPDGPQRYRVSICLPRAAA